MILQNLQILFLVGTTKRGRNLNHDEKTDFPAAVGGADDQPAGLRGFCCQNRKRRADCGPEGPTTMGLVNLLDMERSGKASQHYDLQLYGAADEIVPKLIKGELDMAAIPANLAATLYQKTNGGIQVMAVNTLGVLYVVEKGDSVHSFADLKGRTILSTGKGTTPEYVLRYLLTKNGLDPDKDVKIEYYSEASEVTAQMAASKKDAIAVLPQPM